MKRILAIVLFWFLLGLSALPMIQHKFGFFPEDPLKGAIEHEEYQPFEPSKWWDGSWQEHTDTFLLSEFAFKPFFIRINNQIKYWLYDEFSANGAVVGKERYLYELNYIDTYYGRDFIGHDSIANMVKRLETLQSLLHQKGKLLLVVLAPGKGHFYPEFIPDELKGTPTTETNYNVFSKCLIEREINHIDFQKYFKDNKDKLNHMLYPQYGIHWSYYAFCLAADSMQNKLEYLLGKDLPDIDVDTDNVVMDKPKFGDYDIGEGVNLMFQFPSKPMAYPPLIFGSLEGKDTISSIVIADSFYWGLFNFGFSKIFKRSKFWYYNREAHPRHFHAYPDVASLDMREEIDSTQVFIILSTDASLKQFSWGFIEKATEVLISE